MTPDYDLDEQCRTLEAWQTLEANPPAPDWHKSPTTPEPEPEDIPFTPAQLEFIQKMMMETINRLSLSVDTRETNDYYYCSDSRSYRVEVTLSYKEPDGTWEGERITEASDSFTVNIPSNDRSGY